MVLEYLARIDGSPFLKPESVSEAMQGQGQKDVPAARLQGVDYGERDVK